MAARKLIASGNTNNPAIYDGGTLPNAGDDVWANGFVGTVNANVNYNQFNTANATIGAVSGGSWTAGGVSCTITGNRTAGTERTMNVTLGIGVTLNFVGNNFGGSVTNAEALFLSASSNAGTVNYIGDSFGGTAVGNTHGMRCDLPANCNLNFTGNNYGGTVSVTGGSGMFFVGNCVTVINGNAIGRSTAAIFINTTATSFTMNGISFGSSTTAGVVGLAASNSTTNNVYIQSAEGSPVFFTPGYSGSVKFLTNPTIKVYLAGGTALVLTDPAATQDFPATNDVRNGTTYKNGTRVGSLKVPIPQSVAAGVPTDNTVGVAVLSAAALAATLEAAING
jgi:hypothetical protein